MNTQVTATGMQVKAKAEGGIVIASKQYTSSVATDANTTGYFDTVDDAIYADPTDIAFSNNAAITLAASELYPTSVPSELTHWYHAASNAVDNYAAYGGYQTLDTAYTLKTDGKAYSGNGLSSGTAFALQGQYYLLNQFQIKATDASTYSVWLKGITVSNNNSPAHSANLNKALRICVVVGSNYYFFAPQYETGTLYYYNGSARTAWGSGAIKLGTSPNTQISTSITTTPTDISVYIYYEGEDENCNL